MIKLWPFVPNAPFLYSLKKSENFTVFWCFQGLGKGCIGNKWVIFEKISENTAYYRSIAMSFIRALRCFFVVQNKSHRSFRNSQYPPVCRVENENTYDNQKTSSMWSECLIYAQFTSCFQENLHRFYRGSFAAHA